MPQANRKGPRLRKAKRQTGPPPRPPRRVARHETGLHAAYTTAYDAYIGAPEEERDTLLVRELVDALFEELRAPVCTYVEPHEFCGQPGTWVNGRALCAKHAEAIMDARARQRRRRKPNN